jgi:hypothetical protein
MFEHGCMNHAATIRNLQERITQMQPSRVSDDALPTPPELRALFPVGALRRGSAITVTGSLQLSLAIASAASASGAWCGAIGLPEFGVEAAAELGVALDRFVLVPDPGVHTIGIMGTLSEVLTVLLVRPPVPVRPSDAERLAARLRDHGAALVVLGSWPRSEGTLRVTGSRWHGLGRGHGMLDTHELTVRSEDRRGLKQHTVLFRQGRLAPRGTLAGV